MRAFLERCARGFFRALPFLLIFSVALSVLFYPESAAEEETVRVVRVWNVDTFEGGKGSRTAFLKKVARQIEKTENVYYMVTSYTAEGALSALAEGNTPDMLSFGVGLSQFAERFLPLSRSFAGGEAEGDCLAYPWCAGRYSLFSLSDSFEEEGTVAISQGGSNLSEVAAACAGIGGTPVDSTAAYVGLLNGKYRYLLGTQRDECRFASRGVQVYRKELNAYCDLYQYIAVLSSEKRSDCLMFLETLLGEEAQSGLSSIGMFSLSEVEAEKTVSVLTGEEELKTLSELALSGADAKKLDNFLKMI